MISQRFDLVRDGAVLKGSAWLPEKPRASLLIEHGMAEHHRRYEEFAACLVAQGVAVYSYDKRGHGETAGQPGSPEWEAKAGYFAHRHGWKLVVGDSLAVLAAIHSGALPWRGEHPSGLPLFLMGHSMGSFVARAVAGDPRSRILDLAGLILSGTAGPAGTIGALGRVLAGTLSTLGGSRSPSRLMEHLVSGRNARKATGHRMPRTVFEWLSRDTAAVDRYIEDPWCGRVMSASFYHDMVSGLAGLFTRRYRRSFPRDLPILLFSGDCVPVGGMGKGVTRVWQDYRSWGVADLEFKLYSGGRHEMLNETNRLEVYALVQDWLERHLAAQAGSNPSS